MYAGARNETVQESNSPAEVVKRLLGDLMKRPPGSGAPMFLFLDNFYTTLPLVLELLEKSIYVTGTVRGNRKGLPLDVVDAKLKAGQTAWRMMKSNGKPVLILKWKDASDVLVMSSAFEPRLVDRAKRPYSEEDDEDDEEEEPGKIPEAVSEYRIGMRPVDTHDQISGTYALQHRNVKWWHAVFWYFVQAAVTNAYILERKIGNVDPDLLDFQERLVYELTEGKKYSCRRVQSSAGGRPPATKVVRIDHHPTHTGKRRACVCGCKSAKVSTMCEACEKYLSTRHWNAIPEHAELHRRETTLEIHPKPKRRRST